LFLLHPYHVIWANSLNWFDFFGHVWEIALFFDHFFNVFYLKKVFVANMASKRAFKRHLDAMDTQSPWVGNEAIRVI
jgi:hypothetical protein